MQIPTPLRLTLVIALWATLLVFGWRSWKKVERQKTAGQICDAVAVQNWDLAIQLSFPPPTDTPGLRAAECRALALLALDRRPEATEILTEAMKNAPDPEWLPPPVLTMVLIVEWREEGRFSEAERLAQEAAEIFPNNQDIQLLYFDLRTRLQAEDEVLNEFEQRLPSMGEAALGVALHLAQRRVERRELPAAERLLGEKPPSSANPALRDEWFRVRTALAGVAGRENEVATICANWRQAGGSEAEVLAWHALTLSLYQLRNPEHPTLNMLKAAIDRRDELSDPQMVRNLAFRLISTLKLAGRRQEAVELYDLLANQYDIPLSRQDILQDAALKPSADRVFTAPTGTLQFQVKDPTPEGRLWLSPDANQPVDADFEAFSFSSGGTLVAARRPGEAPQRWVYRDAEGTRASGTVWPPEDQGQIQVDIRLQPPKALPLSLSAANPTASSTAESLPADGRRRIFTIILDCADWRLLQYLRSRGELPTFDTFLRQGVYGVLESRPAFTAAAMDALVYPEHPESLSPIGVVHQLGVELAANTFIGNNPFDALHWFLPERQSIFDTFGAGSRVTVNLLFSEGAIQGGRHGDMIGPKGKQRRFTNWRKRRPLNPQELALIGDATQEAGDNPVAWMEEAAADFDAAETIVDDPNIDLLLLRVDPLDPATHASFADVSESQQDNGQHWLFDLYRYLDFRLGNLVQKLDGDDLLLVLSDHGILTSMEHSPWAVFIAVGGEVSPGRVKGTPHIRGVPRLLADLWRVPTEWPQTGIETWAAHLPDHSTNP